MAVCFQCQTAEDQKGVALISEFCGCSSVLTGGWNAAFVVAHLPRCSLCSHFRLLRCEVPSRSILGTPVLHRAQKREVDSPTVGWRRQQPALRSLPPWTRRSAARALDCRLGSAVIGLSVGSQTPRSDRAFCRLPFACLAALTQSPPSEKFRILDEMTL